MVRLSDANGGGPMVSIVMPVHNQETVLRDTLESVMDQDLESFELICVNDGSTDATAEILGEAVAADDRVTVLSLPGLGAAQARNHGLEHACGKYVQFLDSDDLFHPSMLSRMVSALERTQSELCVCESDRFNHVTGEVEPHIRIPKRWREGSYEHGAFGRETFQITKSVPWNKMVLRDLLLREDIRFQDLPSYNDAYYSALVMWKAKSVYLLHDRLVNYRWALGTSIQDGRAKHPTSALHVAEAAFDRLEDECKGGEAYESLVLYCVKYSMVTMRVALSSETYTPQLHERIVDDLKRWDAEHTRCVRTDVSVRLPVMLLLTCDYDAVKTAYSKRTDHREQGNTFVKKAMLGLRILRMVAMQKLRRAS